MNLFLLSLLRQTSVKKVLVNKLVYSNLSFLASFPFELTIILAQVQIFQCSRVKSNSFIISHVALEVLKATCY